MKICKDCRHFAKNVITDYLECLHSEATLGDRVTGVTVQQSPYSMRDQVRWWMKENGYTEMRGFRVQITWHSNPRVWTFAYYAEVR